MKLLLIDDEVDIRRIGRISLEKIGGFDVVTSSSAAEGIEAAKATCPDAILLDMMMPGMDGLEALSAFRRIESLAHVPVVFMTAKVQRHEVEHYLAVGARGVIKKPFDPMTLPGELRRILGVPSR